MMDKNNKNTEPIAKWILSIGCSIFVVLFLLLGVLPRLLSKKSTASEAIDKLINTINNEEVIVDDSFNISPSTTEYWTVKLSQNGSLKVDWATGKQKIEFAIFSDKENLRKFDEGQFLSSFEDGYSYIAGTYNLGTSFNVEKELPAGTYYVACRNRNIFNTATVKIKIVKNFL